MYLRSMEACADNGKTEREKSGAEITVGLPQHPWNAYRFTFLCERI